MKKTDKSSETGVGREEILKDLEKGFYKNVFKDAQAFSSLLSEQERYLINGLEHPEHALEQLVGLPLTEPQMAFLLRSIVRLWEKNTAIAQHENWPKLKSLVDSRADRFERRTVLYLVDEESSQPVVFEDIEERLPSLSPAERAHLLVETVTQWESTAPSVGRFWARAFADTLVVRCLRKYEELVHGQTPPLPPNASVFPDSFEKKPPGRPVEAKETTEIEIDASVELNRFTSRQATLFFMALAFGRLDVPKDVMQKDIAECIQRLTGHNLKNITTFVSNSTAVKARSEKSAKNLCSDLHTVRTQLERLGLAEGVRRAIAEIDAVVSDLEPDSTEQW